jgi:RNA polymerase sigma-70 factor (ECF subfamily)
MTDDEQLMMRSGEGDMDAFEELVARHQQAALNIAYRFLGDPSLAEDAAQEAFLKLLAGASRYRPLASFRTYLYGIIWHICVDVYRRKRPELTDAMEAHADPSAGPVQAALERERAALVRKAIQELPPRQRMALVLKHFEGLTYEEIGRALDCSPTAVDALLVRAKRKLAEKLQGLL